jgi:hypothetical protein
MRNLLGLVVATVMLIQFGASNELYGRPIKKVWHHGTGGGWSYQYRYDDEWGGRNYWCIIFGGNECSHYDWMAAYNCPCGDPVPQNNFVAYGVGLIQQEADLLGITLPPDLPIPQFELIEE